MEDLTYTPIGPVLHLNKAGELAQKRMKAAKLCDGLYITEPDKTQFVKFIVEYNGVKWVEHQAPAANINPANMAKRMPAILASIEGGRLNELNDYHKELHRRIFNPDAPTIMELKKPERKKPAPLPEGAKKVGVIMFKGCTDEIIDKKVIINEVAPHVYTHTYKLKGYGERVKIIFEIDGVYFQGADNGAYVMEREDFNETCAKAYEHARENVADGAAKGMQYFVEVQKRIDTAAPPKVAQTTETGAEIQLPEEDINYMFYIKPKGAKRFSTYNPGKGTMNTGRVFTELYRKEHLSDVCKWIAEDMSGDFAYQLRSGDGKRIFWEHNPTAATPAETPQISTKTAKTANVSAKEGKAAETEQIGRMPEGREAKCRLAPEWAANIALKYGYTLLCFNLYPNGEFTISVENKNGCRILTKDEFRKLCSQPPQSPETPQAAECIADTPKPQEMARKEPRRTISKKERVYYPAWSDKFARYHFAHVHKMAFVPILAPPGYAPPIRGDCKIGVFQRAKPPNRIQYTKTNILQPP